MEEVRDPSGSLYVGFLQRDEAQGNMTYKICELRFSYLTGKFVVRSPSSPSEDAVPGAPSYMRCVQSIPIDDSSVFDATLHCSCMNRGSTELKAHFVTLRLLEGSGTESSVNDAIFCATLQRGTTCIDSISKFKEGIPMNLHSFNYTSIIAGRKLYLLAVNVPLFKCYDPWDNLWTELPTPKFPEWGTGNPRRLCNAYGFVVVELYGEILISLGTGFYSYNVHRSRWTKVTLVDNSRPYNHRTSHAIAMFSGQGVCLPDSAQFFAYALHTVLSYTLKPEPDPEHPDGRRVKLIFNGEYATTIINESFHRFEDSYRPNWRGIVCLSKELFCLMEATHDEDRGETQLYFDIVMLDIDQRRMIALDSGQEAMMLLDSSLTCFSLDYDVSCTTSKPLRTIISERRKRYLLK